MVWPPFLLKDSSHDWFHAKLVSFPPLWLQRLFKWHSKLTFFVAFILYRQHYQAHVVAQHPKLANPEISKIIGEQWREQAPEVKNEWKTLAEVCSAAGGLIEHWLTIHNRKKNKSISDGTQAIDISLEEEANRTAYFQYHPQQQQIRYVARSVTADPSPRQVHLWPLSLQPSELVHKTNVLWILLHHPVLLKLNDPDTTVQCNLQGWIHLVQYYLISRYTAVPNAHIHNLFKPIMREMRIWSSWLCLQTWNADDSTKTNEIM